MDGLPQGQEPRPGAHPEGGEGQSSLREPPERIGIPKAFILNHWGPCQTHNAQTARHWICFVVKRRTCAGCYSSCGKLTRGPRRSRRWEAKPPGERSSRGDESRPP